MEDVLELYAQPSDVQRPRLCIDERPCQLLDDVVAPLPVKPGQSAKQHGEYARKGTACVFLAYNLETGQRYTEVHQRRRKEEYAHFVATAMRELCGDAKQVQVVQDNLNIHHFGSFYEAFEAPKARALVERLEFHFTPTHASWLNMAEIEFSALARQCLDRRIGSLDVLMDEVAAWQRERNQREVRIHWSFTVYDAREKLQSLYQRVYTKN